MITQMPNRLFLIVGCYNSGTTLLNHILSQHPDVSGLTTEGVALTGEFHTPEEFGWNRLWFKCREQLEICQLKEPPNAEIVRYDWSRHFDGSKPFALEKSIIHGLNIDWFEEAFEHPHFIWIVRNGYTVAEGIRRRTQHKERAEFAAGLSYPIEWCAEQWVVSNQVIEQKLKSVRQFYFLRYEDLMENPFLTIKSLLEWLPVESKDLELPDTFTFQKETLPLESKNVQSLQNLTADDLEKINKVAKQSLAQFGYQILTENES